MNQSLDHDRQTMMHNEAIAVEMNNGSEDCQGIASIASEAILSGRATDRSAQRSGPAAHRPRAASSGCAGRLFGDLPVFISVEQFAEQRFALQSGECGAEAVVNAGAERQHLCRSGHVEPLGVLTSAGSRLHAPSSVVEEPAGW